MTKMIIVGLAILGLSTSAALAKKAAKKPAAPAASAAATAPATTTWPFVVTSADKEMYLKNKRASGMK
jgi:hypothetical protein